MSPTWQRTPCPPWCVGGHGEHDHVDDRVHRSAGLSVPVVSRRIIGADPLRHRIAGQDFEVGLARSDDSETTWLYLGAGPDECIEISLGSCPDLLQALEAMVRRGGLAPGDAPGVGG